MGDIRIRVGVALDNNVRTVYRPYVAAAQQAAQDVMRALNAGHRGAVQGAAKVHGTMPEVMAGPYRTAARRAGDELKKVTTAADREARAQARILERAEREKEARYKRMVRELEKAQREETRIVEREATRRSRAEERERDRNARRSGYWAMRNFSPVTPTLSMGGRIANDVARGAGVDFSAGSMVKSFVDRQKLATQISNSAWIQGDAAPNEAAKRRVDPKTLMADANKAATDTASDAGDILQGMSAFVGKTGDLQTAREAMTDLAKLSKATGTNMGDMLDAAADVSNALGDIPDKSKVVYDTMRAIAGQGQIGSVEISTMAKDMGKLAAMTGGFKLEGSTSKILSSAGLTNATSQNVAIMGAMAQAAKAHGGAGSATVAGNSSMAFIRDMSNRTTMKRWKEQGLDVFADKSHTTIRDPKALILEVLNKTKGDLGQIANLMPNQNSRRVITAFSHTYRQSRAETKDDKTLTEAQKHTKALAAAGAEFDKYLKVTMGAEEIQEKFSAAMNTSASKAQLFQNRMQQVADRTTEKLLPALEKLAPTIEKAAAAFGDFLVWATDHPGQAVATALSASIAKAAIENTIRAGVENLMKGTAGNTAMGKLGSTLAISAIAITTAQIGMAYIDSLAEKESKRVGENAIASANVGNAQRSLTTGGMTAEDRKALEAQLADLKSKRAEMEANPIGQNVWQKVVSGFLRMGDGGGRIADETDAQYAQEQARMMKANAEAIAKLERVMTEIKNGTIKVQVTNHPTPTDPHGTAPGNEPVGH